MIAGGEDTGNQNGKLSTQFTNAPPPKHCRSQLGLKHKDHNGAV